MINEVKKYMSIISWTVMIQDEARLDENKSEQEINNETSEPIEQEAG